MKIKAKEITVIYLTVNSKGSDSNRMQLCLIEFPLLGQKYVKSICVLLVSIFSPPTHTVQSFLSVGMFVYVTVTEQFQNIITSFQHIMFCGHRQSFQFQAEYVHSVISQRLWLNDCLPYLRNRYYLLILSQAFTRHHLNSKMPVGYGVNIQSHLIKHHI